MKQLLLTLCLLAFCSLSIAQAQSRVKSKDLRGTWKLEIPIEKQGETPAERMILNTVEGFIDELDIYFEFKRNNRLKVTVEFWDEKEVEYTEWYINDDGSLSIGDSEHIDTDESVWMFEGSRLVNYDYDRRGRLVREDDTYLKRVKK